MIKLSPTKESELESIYLIEQQKENSHFICLNSKREHQQAFENPEIAYFTIHRELDNAFMGYVILAGIGNPNNSIELRRIVTLEKGKGYGRRAIQLIKQHVFESLKAHRLWLDVFDFNEVGRRLYPSEGFITEGTLRESYLGEEGYRNQILMSLLDREYFKNTKT